MEILLDHSRMTAATPAADCRARVLSNAWVNREYKLLEAQADPLAASAAAGQFFNLLCPASGEDRPFLRRPMSVYAADPSTDRVSFLYKVTGGGTRGLASMERGDVLWMLGPLGMGFSLDPAWRAIVVLGRGVGLATLAPLTDLAAAEHVAVTAILSARGRDQLMAVERFAQMGARVETVLDSDGTSDPQNVERILRRLAAEGRADAFFTCGSTRLMLLMQRLGAELSIPGQVAIEQQMACGLGMCCTCVRNFQTPKGVISRRVCWDGPVFDLAETLP